MKFNARYLPVLIFPFLFVALMFFVQHANHHNGPRITGVVRDSTGRPATNVHVSIYPAGDEGTTDKDGRYDLEQRVERTGPWGDSCYVIARDFKRNLAGNKEILAGVKILDLELKPGLIATGKVVDRDGKGILNANLRVHLSFRRGGTLMDQTSVLCNTKGEFEIDAIPTDFSGDSRFFVGAEAAGYGSLYQNIDLAEVEMNRVALPPITLKTADQKIAGFVMSPEGKPVQGVNVSISGEGQHSSWTNSGPKGGFFFGQVCEGRLTVFASLGEVYGQITVEGGDTQAVVWLDHKFEKPGESKPAAPKRVSLVGLALPDLKALTFAPEAVISGKSTLLCLGDVQQRPSRRMFSLLNERYDSLRQKGIVVLGFQAAAIGSPAFKEWKEANPMSFPMGVSTNNIPDWVSVKPFLPYLILTDSRGRVVAEGFAIEELEAKLGK